MIQILFRRAEWNKLFALINIISSNGWFDDQITNCQHMVHREIDMVNMESFRRIRCVSVTQPEIGIFYKIVTQIRLIVKVYPLALLEVNSCCRKS